MEKQYHCHIYQDLLSHIDGTSPPTPSITVDSKTVANPQYAPLISDDRKAIILLHSSISEEAATKTVGLAYTQAIWTALDAAYNNSSAERIWNLCDALRQSSRGNDSVLIFGRKFKHICDQLAAVDAGVTPTEQVMWFLRGLGPAFETFYTSLRLSRQIPAFPDLLAQAESHEILHNRCMDPLLPRLLLMLLHQELLPTNSPTVLLTAVVTPVVVAVVVVDTLLIANYAEPMDITQTDVRILLSSPPGPLQLKQTLLLRFMLNAMLVQVFPIGSSTPMPPIT